MGKAGLKYLSIVCALLMVPVCAFASHLKIDNSMVSEINAARKDAKIQCSVSWDNSWKDKVNCDGVWLFAKFLAPDGTWKHASLMTASASAFNGADQTPAMFSKGDNPDMGMWVPQERAMARPQQKTYSCSGIMPKTV
jgi:hypothetical protein